MGFADRTGIQPEAQKGQGTGMLSVRDLRPGATAVSSKIAFPINPGDNINKDLSFKSAVVLAGKVVDVDTGAPLPGIYLSRFIRTPGTPYLDSAELKTDADGRFRTNVAPGSEVSFQWRRVTGQYSDGSYLIDQEWQQRNIESYQPMRNEVINRDRTDLVFKLKIIAVQPLTGRVVDEKGQGVKDAIVYVHSQLDSAKTDASGSFSLKAAFKGRDFDICAITNDKKLGGIADLRPLP